MGSWANKRPDRDSNLFCCAACFIFFTASAACFWLRSFLSLQRGSTHYSKQLSWVISTIHPIVQQCINIWCHLTFAVTRHSPLKETQPETRNTIPAVVLSKIVHASNNLCSKSHRSFSACFHAFPVSAVVVACTGRRSEARNPP